jgi:hypothetical protein
MARHLFKMYVSVFLSRGVPIFLSIALQHQTNAAELPRIGTPEDIAGMASFLAGKD